MARIQQKARDKLMVGVKMDQAVYNVDKLRVWTRSIAVDTKSCVLAY